MESLKINGKTLRLTIQRKPIRNVILRLKSPDELLVSAPYACSNAEVLGLLKLSAAGLPRTLKSWPANKHGRRKRRPPVKLWFTASRYNCSG